MTWRDVTRRAVVGAALALATSPAWAADHEGFEGTWGGASGALSAQVIIAGGAVIGFFWREDYVDARDSRLSADGKSLSFAFGRDGQAALTRTGAATATLSVNEGGRTTTLALMRD